MYRKLFQALTLSELEKYAGELEIAVESHAQWLAQVNRALICHLPPNSADISDAPHHLCRFGSWYHSEDNADLAEVESFAQIGDVHREMHLCARELLLKGENISTDEYDRLVQQTEQLRNLLNRLHDDLNRDRRLVSKLMSKVFQNAAEGVVITAPDSTIINVNRAFTEVTGYSEQEALGNTPKMLQSGIQGQEFYDSMWQELQQTGQWQGEIWNRKKSGETYLEWLSIAAVYDEAGELSHYVAIFSDITNEKESEERLQFLAHYDQLTRLPNRILFADRLKQALAQALRHKEQVAIMFLDLDGFKAVNDTLGHNAGDDLLLLVAERLAGCLRASDTVARFGGDEFTIVLPAIDSRQSVVRIAEKIGEAIARPYELSGHEAFITTSIGISLYPEDGDEPQQLIQNADHAMYHAKRHGKNHHEFYSNLNGASEAEEA